MFIMSVAASAVLMLLWNGFYLHDPRSAGSAAPLIQQTAAATVIILCWLATIRTKKTRDQINYRILPQEYKVEQTEEKKTADAPYDLDLDDAPADTTAGPAEPERHGRRRFTDEDAKAQDAFKDYLETL